ncbi:MAG: UvrD-helicase domain-containing protein [Burkholderiaceae bacterium]|nr:UvrD-helicase domain-containing protein [Burkholderiaceae bacterium]
MNDLVLPVAQRPRAPADADVRAQAVDPSRSFIVQAPAGSGKTELLIRRLLVLLATVDAPEEIVALTFTRKAAGEMRARVIEALERARSDTPPDDAHARDTWTLARAALARDAACGWQLTSSPGRLRIQTIDGLCTMLVRRLPLLSRLGGMPALHEAPEPLYREAARAALGLLEDGTPEQSAAVATLLLHLDNRSGAVEDLLVSLLGKRDQWLRHVAQPAISGDRALLEAALARRRSAR